MVAMTVSRRSLIPIVVGIVVLLVINYSIPSHSLNWQSSLHFKAQLSNLIFSTDACPSPDSQPPPILHDRQICRALPSATGQNDFALQLCVDPATCNAFTLRIERTSQSACQLAQSAPDPSESKALSDWVRNERGPDAFLMRTDGAERYGSTWSTYEGNCSYRFDVSLHNSGPVYLEVWNTFQVGYPRFVPRNLFSN